MLAAQLAQDGIETSDQWIVERTGIRARHFAEPELGCSDLAVQAARRALAAADVDAEAIDRIIVATSKAAAWVAPSLACTKAAQEGKGMSAEMVPTMIRSRSSGFNPAISSALRAAAAAMSLEASLGAATRRSRMPVRSTIH